MKKIIKNLITTVLSTGLVFSMSFNVNTYISHAETLNTANTSDDVSYGMYTNLYNMEDTAFGNAIYVSTDGKSGASGSKNDPLDLKSAIEKASAKESVVILLEEGNYSFSSQLTIGVDNNGTSSAYKILKACKGAKVTLDFSGESYNVKDTSVNQRGIQLNGNYWYFSGFTIYGAADNGLMVSGSHNIIEQCIFDSNKDTGLQISRYSSSVINYKDWPSYNYIINCTSKNNCDPATYENADGFAAKLTCGDGNVFDGCLSYNNSDDGWDLYAKTATGPIGVVTIQNSISMRNGVTEDGTTESSCDGNGFKLGGSGVGTPHIIKNCIAIENLHHGFTDNNNPSALQLLNCTAFDNNQGGNKNNFSLYRCKDAYVANAVSYTTNNTSDKFVNLSGEFLVFYNSNKWYQVTDLQTMNTSSSTLRGTAIQTGIKANDFENSSIPAVGTDFNSAWRNSDGTIYTNGVALIASSSDYANFSTDGKSIGARFSKNNNATQLVVAYDETANKTDTEEKTTEDTTTPPVNKEESSDLQEEENTGETLSDDETSTSDNAILNFTEKGVDSDFYTVTGNLTTSKGSVVYKGLTLTTALKMETNTLISFITDQTATLTLVFNEDCNKNIKIDGENYTISSGILEVTLEAGEHIIGKADSVNLYYIELTEK